MLYLRSCVGCYICIGALFLEHTTPWRGFHEGIIIIITFMEIPASARSSVRLVHTPGWRHVLGFHHIASQGTCGWGRADGCGCRAASAGGRPAPVTELTSMDQIPCDVSTENDFSLPCICWGGLISFRKGSKQLLGSWNRNARLM